MSIKRALILLSLMPVFVWIFAVVYGAAGEVVRRYREATREQNRHYRGWMR
jgi:heme/copper-type cytochrome/quinol oxidase subunit 2